MSCALDIGRKWTIKIWIYISIFINTCGVHVIAGREHFKSVGVDSFECSDQINKGEQQASASILLVVYVLLIDWET